MISAEKAAYLMQQYEEDYDQFLDKLRAKVKAKKKETTASEKKLKNAEANKLGRLADKARNLLDKVGGIEGARSTIQNVTQYFKKGSGPPADYSMSVEAANKGAEEEEKKIFGLPPIAVYAGGGLLLLVAIYGISQYMKSRSQPVVTTNSLA